jgi:hypothetical protein
MTEPLQPDGIFARPARYRAVELCALGFFDLRACPFQSMALVERFPDAAWSSRMKPGTPIAPKGASAVARRRDLRRISQRPSRRALKASVPARSRFTWLAGGAVAALSFVVAMQLTKPATPTNPAIAILVASVVSDPPTLMAAVKAAGLKGSADVRGAIDEMKRLDPDRVSVRGWVAERSNGGAPITVIVFAGGQHKATMQTRGRHADVVQGLGLSDAASATNASFDGVLACSPRQKLMVVAVTDGNVYGHFATRSCP